MGFCCCQLNVKVQVERWLALVFVLELNCFSYFKFFQIRELQINGSSQGIGIFMGRIENKFYLSVKFHFSHMKKVLAILSVIQVGKSSLRNQFSHFMVLFWV